ncbi:MAG: GTP-binding protein [Enterobacterales bacterium]|jgi:GTP-binding protein
MRPVIALVGRPNVGKSTLFNRLTRRRDALVANEPGLTRDRQYGHADIAERECILIDTGGISGDEVGIDTLMAGQSLLAMEEADVILFLVDGRVGIHPSDELIVKHLRTLTKPCFLVVNKIDGLDAESITADFYELGFGEPIGIAATHGRGVQILMQKVALKFPEQEVVEDEDLDDDADRPVKLALIGRPNVGKSTLVNRMLGEERVIVYDMPGTTRDSIYIEMERRDKKYTLIDTAGVRRRGKVKETVEKFSVIKTLQAIDDANVVIMVLDAQDGLVDQDMSLLGYILDSGRSLVLAVNKWDGMEAAVRLKIKDELKRRLMFVDFAEWFYISALHGTGVGDLFAAVDSAYRSSRVKMNTTKLTEWLKEAQVKHPPPLVKGRRIKMRMAHTGGHNPPRIVIHGNQLKRLADSYIRYLHGFFRKKLHLVGTPIKFEWKEGVNPFKDKRINATPLQQYKDKRERISRRNKDNES